MLKMILFNRMKGMMMKKKKAARRIKPFDAGAYELFNNGLYRHKAIPDKKKAEKLKRKKVDIREYQPFLLRGIRLYCAGHGILPWVWTEAGFFSFQGVKLLTFTYLYIIIHIL